MRTLLRSLIRNATVTSGEATDCLRIDAYIRHAAEMLPFEQVEIVNSTTGERSRTWIEGAAEGSGEVRISTVARAGDTISILSYVTLHEGQTLGHLPRIVTLDAGNHVRSVGEGSDPA